MTKETHLSLEEVTALKEMFRAQSTELLEDYGRYVLELEKSSEPGDSLKAIQRIVHTVKGDSMSLEFDRLSELAHRLEDFLEPLKKADQRPVRQQIDLLLACGDGMCTLLEDYCSEPPKKPMGIGPLLQRLNEAMPSPEELRTKLYKVTISFQRKCEMHSAGAFMIRQRLEPLATIHETTPDPESSTIERSRTWTLIVETDADMDTLKRAARVAGVAARVTAEPYEGPFTEVGGDDGPNELETEPPAEETKSRESEATSNSTPTSSDQLRMEVGKIDRIMNLVGELVIGRSMVSQALSELSQADEAATGRLNTANNFLERTLTELQAVVLKIRMVPVDHVFRRFPRVVRDLAHSGDKKEVKLEVRGAKTELDKSIVDALHEPMLHLVRNAIDHGLEPREARVKAGKPAAGKLTLAAFYEGNHVHILIEDDGRGIDRDESRETSRRARTGHLSGDRVPASRRYLEFPLSARLQHSGERVRRFRPRNRYGRRTKSHRDAQGHYRRNDRTGKRNAFLDPFASHPGYSQGHPRGVGGPNLRNTSLGSAGDRSPFRGRSGDRSRKRCHSATRARGHTAEFETSASVG